MIIIIGETPLSKNQYTNMHWGKRARYKQRIKQHMQCDLLYRNWHENSGLNGEYERNWEKAQIKFDIYFPEKMKRRRDIQNYLGGGLISWIDNLVDLKIIKDDSVENIGQPIVEFYDEQDCPRTEITIIKKE